MLNKTKEFSHLAGIISEESANDILSQAIPASRRYVSEYIERLLIRAGVTPYELQKITGISRQIIEQALSQSRSISKLAVFALCLVLKLDEDAALSTVYSCGFGLTKAPEDLVFSEFISRGIHRLKDYADSVKDVYALIGCEDQLPAFFSREYTNDTI